MILEFLKIMPSVLLEVFPMMIDNIRVIIEQGPFSAEDVLYRTYQSYYEVYIEENYIYTFRYLFGYPLFLCRDSI